MTAGAAAAVLPALAGENAGDVLPLVGFLAVALLAAGVVVGWAGLLASSVAILAVEYALSLGESVDGRAPLYAGFLVLCAELAFWSLDLRVPAAAEPGTLVVRSVFVALAVVGAVAVGGLMLALTAVPALPGGVGWEVVGLAAAAGALTLVVVLARPRA